MTEIQKIKAYNKLKDTKFVNHDLALLKKVLPGAPILKSGLLNSSKVQQDLLWQLLDVLSPEEILENRNSDELSEEELNELTKQTGVLYNQIYTVESFEEKKVLIDQIKGILKNAPDFFKTKILLLSESIIPNFVKKKEAETKLLNININSALQPELNSIAIALNLEVPDRKLVTLRPALTSYQLNLEKIDEGDGIEKTEILEGEKEELQDEKEELQDEKEELEQTVENLEAENEELKQQLDEEKKNLNQAPPQK